MVADVANWLVVFLCVLAAPAPEHGQPDAAGTYRRAWSFENEVLYVGDQLALWRYVSAGEEGEVSTWCYLTPAHWLNEPELDSQTGDVNENGKSLVNDIKALAWLPEQHLLIGRGYPNPREGENLPYFLARTDTKQAVFYQTKDELRGALLSYYQTEEEMMGALAAAGNYNFRLRSSELYFRRMVEDTLRKQAKGVVKPGG